MRLPRTIRLDPSDAMVFERAAEPGEWAVTGSFLFWDTDIAGLTGKARAAFRAGFVGVESLGFSTLVAVSEASADERKEAIASLARHIATMLGAPSSEHAWEAAREEVDFAGSLCGHDVNTILALHRTLEAGEIREQFRTLRPRGRALDGADRLHAHARAFEFVEIDEEVEERVDLIDLLEGKR